MTADGPTALWLLAILVPALAYTAWLLARRRATMKRTRGETGRESAFPAATRSAPAGRDDGPEAAGAEGEIPPPFSFYEETFRTLVASVGLSQSDQERSYIEVIGAMVATAHARDHETIGHSFRVARYAVTLAERMRLGGETLTAIEWGALLHDVGKIAVPEGVLRKSGPLTEEETRVMREHPRRGYQMLRGLLFLGTALDVVLSHHERWDGRGYPNGLVGDTIPLSARIFAVVDTYDAITSDRPYRSARSHAEAVEELRRVAGSQLDPAVVQAFLAIPEDELADLRDLTRAVETGPDAPSLRTAFDPTGEGDLNGDGLPYGGWRVEEVG
jgi:putative nucleotidyltransferase with HDIG domain